MLRAVRKQLDEIPIRIKDVQLCRSVRSCLGSGDDFDVMLGENADSFGSTGDLKGDVPSPADGTVFGDKDGRGSAVVVFQNEVDLGISGLKPESRKGEVGSWNNLHPQ